MHRLRFRQVHLDFHTSPAIEGIGADFDKAHWQRTLKRAHVDSVTIFAVCHHGWSYYDTKIGQRHPHLGFDLTAAQLAACKEIDVNAPVYISAGLNNRIADECPQWRNVNSDGRYSGWARKPTDAGFRTLCFNSPYLDLVCDQIKEVATLFPQADGLFMDIILKVDCCCPWCLGSMDKLHLRPEDPADVSKHAELVLQNYYRRTLEALRSVRATMPLFQNSGHVQRGRRSFFDCVSHLELESLPTWGWGYDHFPMSAAYARLSGLDFLGMTGKFHTTWGEFGGFKHPNALRYECTAMIAMGSKCSVGDQLAPRGRLDDMTYDLIGQAYAEVEAKEPWCRDARNLADVAILSSVAVHPQHPREDDADTGAARVLLEGHVLFDILDAEMDFAPYKVLVLSDDVIVSAQLKAKLDAYVQRGGKLLLTGRSGLDEQGQPMFDIGATIEGPGEFMPEYILPSEACRPAGVTSPLVVYGKCHRMKVTDGESLGQVYHPYFNRDWRHFCSHQHAPATPEPSGFDCGVRKGSIVYLPMPIFTVYRAWGQVYTRQFVLNCLAGLMGEATVQTNLPSTARVTLTEQADQNRHVLHLLYANLISRGGKLAKLNPDVANAQPIEVIEELLPLHDTRVSVRLAKPVRRVTLEPQGCEIAFEIRDGRVELTVDRFACHQMVVLHS